MGFLFVFLNTFDDAHPELNQKPMVWKNGLRYAKIKILNFIKFGIDAYALFRYDSFCL